MNGSRKKTAIEYLSENVLDTKFENFDEWTLKNAKDRIIDVIGCIIGGANAAGNDGLVNIVRNWGGREEATILAYGDKVPTGNAAMVNSILCRSNDFEVMFAVVEEQRIPSHNSGTTIPTALAMGEAYGISGKEFITAMLVGDDVSNRVLAAGGWDFSLGWDGTMTLPIFGAVSIAGKILGLNKRQMKHAFGIAVNMVAGAIQSLWDGATTFKLGQGTSARNGIFAAELAKQGWTGLEDALTGKMGYYYLYNKGRIEKPEILTQYLGQKYYVEQTFKVFPCGIPNAGVIRCALTLHEKYKIKTEEIIEWFLLTPPRHYYTQPFKIGEFPQANAIFSNQYCAACALLRGRVKLQDFTEEAIRDPKINELIARSRFVFNEPGTATVGVRIKLKDGRELEERIDIFESQHIYPTQTEIHAKFWEQVEFSQTISKKNAEEILRIVERFEELDNVKNLVKLLVP